MGYFQNGTSGDMFREAYCDRCIHDDPENEHDGALCPIWTLHLGWNYDAVGKQDDPAREAVRRAKQEALDAFIPRTKDGDNEKCLMFTERVNADIPGQERFPFAAKPEPAQPFARPAGGGASKDGGAS